MRYFRAEPGRFQERFSTSTLKYGGGGGSRKTLRTISPTTAYLQHIFRHQFPSHAKQGSMLAWACRSNLGLGGRLRQELNKCWCKCCVCCLCPWCCSYCFCAVCAFCVGVLGAVRAALVLRVCCECCLCSLSSWCFRVVCGGAAGAACAAVEVDGYGGPVQMLCLMPAWAYHYSFGWGSGFAKS